MRIVSGRFKGKRFSPPANNWPTRPTTDYAKEALFNILHNNFYFEDINILDLFGGTGNLSYEFISRGCTDVTYVENFGKCIAFTKKMIRDLEIESEMKVLKMDVFSFLERTTNQYDIIFADPPYHLPKIPLLPNLIFEKKVLKKEGWLIIEHDSNNDFQNNPYCFDVRNYGGAIFSFFSNESIKES